MGSWNHRVIVKQIPENAADGKSKLVPWFGIHEVHYEDDEATKPRAYTCDPVTVTGDKPDDLTWTLEKMTLALTKPFLWGGERFPEVYVPETT